jgi:hypothetical protein
MRINVSISTKWHVQQIIWSPAQPQQRQPGAGALLDMVVCLLEQLA